MSNVWFSPAVLEAVALRMLLSVTWVDGKRSWFVHSWQDLTFRGTSLLAARINYSPRMALCSLVIPSWFIVFLGTLIYSSVDGDTKILAGDHSEGVVFISLCFGDVLHCLVRLRFEINVEGSSQTSGSPGSRSVCEGKLKSGEEQCPCLWFSHLDDFTFNPISLSLLLETITLDFPHGWFFLWSSVTSCSHCLNATSWSVYLCYEMRRWIWILENGALVKDLSSVWKLIGVHMQPNECASCDG